MRHTSRAILPLLHTTTGWGPRIKRRLDLHIFPKNYA